MGGGGGGGMSSVGCISARVLGEEGILLGRGSADEGKGGRKAGTWEGGFQFAVRARLRGDDGLDMGERGSGGVLVSGDLDS